MHCAAARRRGARKIFFGTYFVLAVVGTLSPLQDEARTGQVLRCVRPWRPTGGHTAS